MVVSRVELAQKLFRASKGVLILQRVLWLVCSEGGGGGAVRVGVVMVIEWWW